MGHESPIILTPGDPAGIGPEISLKAAIARPGQFVLIGDTAHLTALANEFGLDVTFQEWQAGQDLDPEFLSIYPLNWAQRPNFGKPDSRNSETVIWSIQKAVELCKHGTISAIVTNPIAKSVLYEAGFQYPGHTEYLAALDGADKQPIMMLANTHLRAVPLTIHQSLASVPATITKQLVIEAITDICAAMKKNFGIVHPHIAVCGLNPHAGEDGHLGTEDKLVITPALEALKTNGMNVSGPHPADTLFTAEARTKYDVAIGMYHDQVLIPVKTLDFHNSVNITLNLSFIRTSPDHGTAFEIAGTGAAKADSLIAAIDMAQEMSKHRHHNEHNSG